MLATQSLAPTAYRAVCQLNENGGIFARGHVIPEMNHNEIVAWGEEKAAENQSLLIFTWDGTHQRNEMRLDWYLDNITVEPTWGLMCEGESHLEALLYAVDLDGLVVLCSGFTSRERPNSNRPDCWTEGIFVSVRGPSTNLGSGKSRRARSRSSG